MTVHPHMRGELMVVTFPASSVAGSSPHAWGTHTPSAQDGRSVRFIPTCVGNSSLNSLRLDTATVHPHMRGELLLAVQQDSCYFGSSPHAWGTLS